MKASFLKSLISTSKLSFLIPLYSFVTFFIIFEIFEKGSVLGFLDLGTIGLAMLTFIYFSFMAFYLLPIIIGCLYILISKTVWSVQKIKIIGLIIGITCNTMHYIVNYFWSVEPQLTFVEIIQFVLHTGIVAIISMILFVKEYETFLNFPSPSTTN